jgi:uncharacterized protein (TIGR02246 family)
MLQGASEVSIRTTVKKRARRTVRKATPSSRKSARPTNAAATIREIGHNWAQNWNTGELEQLVAAYAPDAVYLPPHHEAVHGRDSIRDYLRVPRSHGVSDLAFDVTYIKQSGDVAWDVGAYRISMPQNDGTTRQDHGKYLTVWKRAGKNWLIAADAWSSDLPAAH